MQLRHIDLPKSSLAPIQYVHNAADCLMDSIPMLYCIVFIHFYSASRSMSLSDGLHITEFIGCRQLKVKDLSKVISWQLERYSNPRPSGRKASNLPMGLHAQQIPRFTHILLYERTTPLASFFLHGFILKFSSSLFYKALLDLAIHCPLQTFYASSLSYTYLSDRHLAF